MWVYGGTTGSASYLRDVWRTGNGGECRRCRRSMAHRCCCSPHAALPRPAVHWVQVHPSPEALPRRAGAQAAVINGHLFLLGGRGTESPDGSNTISYTRDGSAGPALLPSGGGPPADPNQTPSPAAAASWTTLPSEHAPPWAARDSFGALRYGDHLYLMGGSPPDQTTASVYASSDGGA